VDNLLNERSVSGKFGGVAGVLAGVINFEWNGNFNTGKKSNIYFRKFTARYWHCSFIEK
jgi:hypothetical protein